MSDPTTPEKIARAVAADRLAPLRRVTIGRAETPTMRERLAQHLHNHDREMVVHSDRWPDWHSTEQAIRDIYLSRVDAILREMKTQSQAVIDAGEDAAAKWGNANSAWQAMIQHILNETKD